MGLKAIVDNLDDVPEQFHELYTERNGKFEISGIEGIRSEADVQRLQTALTKERQDHKSLKDKFSPFKGMEIEEVISKLDRYDELETAAGGKMDDAAIDKIVETRIRTKLAPVERERDTFKNQLSELTSRIGEYESKERSRTIGDAVRSAVAKAEGFQQTAIEDALMLAGNVFEVDEDGSVRTKDGVGVTPGVDPSVWLSDMQQKRPHWWGETVGGNSRGGNGGNSGNNPFSAKNWNMTEQGKLVRENPTRAEQLARAAGTTVGGRRPSA